ncbi:MAG: ABC transporter ATP-binding protein, partial [Bacteroidota bacterium]|nr:ABC transporter ATP-binding protein [Bacteroidota bacterium]
IDSESEILIQQAIDKLIKGRTSIVIAHRLSTIRKANKIIVLDRGEIIEAGTHQELLQRKGSYYKLHQMQFETQEVV